MIKVRPGLLVALHTRIMGGVQYRRTDLEHQTDGEVDVTRWETVRTIEDVAEHDAAVAARAAARNVIARSCINTAFGLVCVEGRESDLDAAYREASAILADFNATARTCEVRLSMLRGRIASTDAEAIAAVQQTIAELVTDLERATRAGDVKEIRKIAAQATASGGMLDSDTPAASALGEAVTSARSIARCIVKQVKKGSVDLAEVLTRDALAPISMARLVFDARPESVAVEVPAVVSDARFAGIGADLDAAEVA